MQSDIRAFVMAGGLNTTTLETSVWVETDAEGGRRLMAALRQGEENVASHRQENSEANETRKGFIVHGSVEPAK